MILNSSWASKPTSKARNFNSSSLLFKIFKFIFLNITVSMTENFSKVFQLTHFLIIERQHKGGNVLLSKFVIKRGVGNSLTFIFCFKDPRFRICERETVFTSS